MGRFYKTVKPEFLDYMYELPKEEMMRGVAIADQKIDKKLEDTSEIGKLLKLQAIDKDNPRANEILEGYEGEIKSLSEKIQEDPMKYLRNTGDINDLRSRVHEDFTRGEAFKIQSNYDTRKANYDAMREAQIKNPDKYNYGDVELLQQKLDEEYLGYNSGGYNVDRLREFVDINDMDKFGEKYKADVLNKYGAYKASDGFLYTDKDEKKWVDPMQVAEDIMDIMQADRRLMDYYEQQKELGKIDQEGIDELLTNTAIRIGEKYGFIEESKGRTSIKRDSKDVAIAGINRQYELDNPVGNTTLGKVLNTPVLDRWNKDENGNTLNNYTVNGVNEVIRQIDNGIKTNAVTAIELAQDNGIKVDADMTKAILEGDFSSLITAMNEDGGVIDPKVIYGFQQNHAKNLYDKNLVEAKLRKALENATPEKSADQWLAEEKYAPQVVESEMEFTTFGVISPENLSTYKANIKAQRDELNGSEAWWGDEIEIDQSSMEDLPPKMKHALAGRNTISINELIKIGVIKRNQEYIGDDDEGRPQYEYTKGYSNFKVNGKYAKPASALDGNGELILQTEMNIGGVPIKILVPEKSVSNKSNKSIMDLDKMAAGYEFNRAVSEGVIDEGGYMIDGQLFYRDSSGSIVAQGKGGGVITAEEAVSRIGATKRIKREQLMQVREGRERF